MTRNEVVELIGVQEAESLVQRLQLHFETENYEFTLARLSKSETSGETDVSELLRPPSVLMVDGTANVEDAIRARDRIRQILSSEELEYLKIQYEIKDRGYYMLGKDLHSK